MNGEGREGRRVGVGEERRARKGERKKGKLNGKVEGWWHRGITQQMGLNSIIQIMLSDYQGKGETAREGQGPELPGTDSSFSLTVPPASSYCSKMPSLAPVGTTPIWGSSLASLFKLEAPGPSPGRSPLSVAQSQYHQAGLLWPSHCAHCVPIVCRPLEI